MAGGAPALDPARLVFIDETWTKTNMARARGRAPGRVRLVAAAPHGHWKTTTFVAALRVDGLTAPLVVDGAVNGETFEAYIRQFVVPTLSPGDAVIMDNLAAHKRAGVREAIESVVCRLLFLPPYSPDLNPIERAFAKLKALLRKAGERTFEGLWRRLGRLVDEFTPRECRNFLAHAGYRGPSHSTCHATPSRKQVQPGSSGRSAARPLGLRASPRACSGRRASRRDGA